MTSGTEITPENRRTFLDALRESANISHSARAAGFSRRCAYSLRDRDPEFANDWDDALDDAIDGLEKEAQRRAFEGCEEPIGFHLGEHGGTFVKKYSDTLAIFLLKAHRPERFRDSLHLSGGIETGNEKLEEVSLSLLQKFNKMIDDEAEGGDDGDSSA